MFMILVVIIDVAARRAFNVTAVHRAFRDFRRTNVRQFTHDNIVSDFAMGLYNTYTVMREFDATFSFRQVRTRFNRTFCVNSNTRVFQIRSMDTILVFGHNRVLTQALNFFSRGRFIN